MGQNDENGLVVIRDFTCLSFLFLDLQPEQHRKAKDLG